MFMMGSMAPILPQLKDITHFVFCAVVIYKEAQILTTRPLLIICFSVFNQRIQVKNVFLNESRHPFNHAGQKNGTATISKKLFLNWVVFL